MGACGVTGLVALLLAAALLTGAASARSLEGEASSGKGAAAPPTAAPGGSQTSDSPNKSRQSSAAGQQAESGGQPEPPPPPAPAKNTKQQPSTSEGDKKGKEEGGAQASATSPPPPPPGQGNDAPKGSPPPPPGGSGQNDAGEGGKDHGDTGSKGKDDAAENLKEVMGKCATSHNCSVGTEFFACLQVSDNAVIVLNRGQNNITVEVKEASSVDMDRKSLILTKGAYGQMVIKKIGQNGGNITLNGGNGDCIIHVSGSVSDWQQPFQQFAEYATRLNPIYGAYAFGFTVVLVGVVCLCCKFARRKGDSGVSYQQLEMSAPAPNSSSVDNTTSTADGWDEGWDDDWDDEETPARPSDNKPASNVSANGLSLRSRTDNKDGWDVDWDD